MPQETDYILIIYCHWSIETTLWIDFISLIVLLLLFYLILCLLSFITHLSKNIQR
ncbi:heme biosynthesis HemY N-terminal domain-containing protein [Coxiella-like endosymbiont]|uniref:heme biosynthesis HemY N-terminal domain-containing protein n=1 Tax=Coxiella-like endosymbiont TaxID=1592897 RepID=UPI0011AEEB6B